ncbi:MAG TPA: acyl-homoserine-lactone synthase [Noviherbaspirillum sp.]|jgi:N-acyl-L-homoserine lactone synthetase|uniref:acyl-homoserine-lactone synthase n=1 Tax=Noviherbaspirillum sp. TaxID=1926288 RepID=UPI002DDCBF7B|nr:acyl-homoserine-lactone synthase [Noviherbaspirillum sp.]HEV2609994.1 acyl-homoserine-lactone synthase [Noviherbaspirillum sp.]
MQTMTGRSKDLTPEFETALAQYRHKIFIERLGWSLPVDDGLERDQFDHPETIYVVTREPDGAICGCARLLPTTEPYLLSEVFRHLMHGQPVPKSRDVWELSRFAAASVKSDSPIDAALNTRALLAEAVRTAAAHGAKRLITVSPLGIERLLQRMGVHAHRAGPPMFAEGKPVFACWIEIDEQTLNALNILPSESTRGTNMLQAVDRILSAVVESGLAMSPRHA